MQSSETEDGAKDRLETSDETGGVIGLKTLMAALVVALASGVVAWSLGETIRVAEVVDLDEFYGGVELSIARATRNGVVSYAILGAILSLGLGMSAGSLKGRRSIARLFLAGLAGVVIGACAGVLSSYPLFPAYFRRMETADLTLSILIHLGIWTAIGGASGLAFGIGSGRPGLFVKSLIGGIMGAALGAILFDMCGAFFPLAHTERPLAEQAGTRLTANIILSLTVALGIVFVASQRDANRGERDSTK